jgi:hypothetical protein
MSEPREVPTMPSAGAGQLRCTVVPLGTAEEENRVVEALQWLLGNARDRDELEVA